MFPPDFFGKTKYFFGQGMTELTKKRKKTEINYPAMKNSNQKKNHPLIKNLSKTVMVGFLTIATCLVSSNAIAANSQGSDHGVKSSEQGFLSKQTTEMEFTLAIVTIIVGLIVSEKMQGNQSQKQ